MVELTQHSLKLGVIGALSLLAGCASGFTDPAQRAAALQAFREGRAQLTCTTNACQLAWAGNQPAARNEIARRNPEAVAELVLAANWDENVGWTYLGWAAERLGHIEAARRYYTEAVARSREASLRNCAFQVNTCAGLVLPRDAQARLAALPPPATAAAQPARRPATVRAGGAPPTPAPAAAGPAAPRADDWVLPDAPLTPPGSAPAGPAPNWVLPGSPTPTPAAAAPAAGGWVTPVTPAAAPTAPTPPAAAPAGGGSNWIMPTTPRN